MTADEPSDAPLSEPKHRQPSRDARALRTRSRIIDAYLRVAAESAEAPRVSKVVRVAGVNRSSFYAHFADMEDLTLQVLDAALGDLSKTHSEMASRHRQSTRATALTAGNAYLTAIELNAPALRAAVQTDPAHARTRIAATIERTMLQFLASTPGWDGDSTRSRAIGRFVSHGWAGSICAWLVGELPVPRDALLRELVALNPDPARLPIALSPRPAAQISAPQPPSQSFG